LRDVSDTFRMTTTILMVFDDTKCIALQVCKRLEK
jgi:hypothetical protein